MLSLLATGSPPANLSIIQLPWKTSALSKQPTRLSLACVQRRLQSGSSEEKVKGQVIGIDLGKCFSRVPVFVFYY